MDEERREGRQDSEGWGTQSDRTTETETRGEETTEGLREKRDTPRSVSQERERVPGHKETERRQTDERGREGLGDRL